MSFTVRLTKGGLRHESHEDGETAVRLHRPTSVPELLRYWHYLLSGIDDDVTLGDLLALLRGVEGIDHLSAMFSCDVGEFLAEAERPSANPVDDGIEHLEVYNTAWLEGTTKGKRGRLSFCPPYRVTRDFHGWGAWDDSWEDAGEQETSTPRTGGIAIEFTPVNELVHLPLRYDPRVRFESDRIVPEPLFETELTIDFGEFVHAILWEIGFFGSPGDRNEQRGQVEAAVDEIDRETSAPSA